VTLLIALYPAAWCLLLPQMTQVDDEIKFGMIEAISHLIHRDYEAIVQVGPPVSVYEHRFGCRHKALACMPGSL
jgi:hypothetical protein